MRLFRKPLADIEPKAAALGLLFVAFGYVAGGFLFVVGGIDGAEIALALQAATAPVFVGVSYLTYTESPRQTVPLVVATALGGALHGIVATGSPAGIFGFISVGSATGVWAVFGYALGTALRWRRDYVRVPEDEVFRACGLVAVCGFAVGIVYLFFWEVVVIGLGDVLQ